MHKTQGSPIPQVDGVGDNKPDDEPFCKICKECHEETKTSEDLNFHVINNHEMVDLYQAYGLKVEDTVFGEDLLSMACFLIDGGGVPPHYDTRVFVTIISEGSIFLY